MRFTFSKFAILMLAGAALVGAAVSASPAEAQATGGPLLGSYASPLGTQGNIDALVELEQTLGTTLPIVRAFETWDNPVGADRSLHTFVRDGGRDLVVSVKPVRDDGSAVLWADIANARPGSLIYREIQEMASGFRRYSEPVIFAFHHEPEAAINTHFGTSDEFKAAFRNIHSIFEAEGVNNVLYSVILTEWSFEVGEIFPNDRRRAELWYPGDDVVDVIGSDGYNWNNCRGNTTDPWTSLEDDMAPFLRFADRHPDKQLMLGEFGSDEGRPGQKAEWLADAQQWFRQSPDADRFIALLYFHDDGRQEGIPQCEWWLDSSPSSTNAAIAWFRDNAFKGSLSAVTPECNGRAATIVGTPGRDIIFGTPGPDVIVGLGGNDTIRGLGGNDTICGGPGRDNIAGGLGHDRIFGEAGADEIVGGRGRDRLSGGGGPDQISGGRGVDVVRGGAGVDRCGAAGRNNQIICERVL